MANANLYSLFLTSSQYDGLDKAQLTTFIEQIYQIVENKWDQNFVFYAWFDAAAGQLRFSSLPSEYKTTLPFGGKIKTTYSMDNLVHEVFNEYSDMYKETSLCTSTVNDPLLVLVI